MTLPSLGEMSGDKTTVFVLTSEELPPTNMRRLERLESEWENIEVIRLSRKGRVIHKMHLSLLSRGNPPEN